MKISDWILYNDQQVIAFNKPAGIPSQKDKTGDLSIHEMGMAYCKKDIYLVHRLDRPVSGVIIFAKNKAAAAHLSQQFREHQITKKYLAIVPRKEVREQELVHFIYKDKRTRKMRVSDEQMEGSREAKMKMSVTSHIDRYMLLNIEPISGRLHQIRVQLAHIGLPVKGDIRYGSRRGNQDRSIDLHCGTISFTHPTKHQKIEVNASPPLQGMWKFFNQSEEE